METSNASLITDSSVVSVRGLAIIALRVCDLERSVRFYKSTLGFVDAEQCLSPGVTLESEGFQIYLSDGAIADNRQPMIHPEVRICLTMPGVIAAAARLKEAGVTIIEEAEAGSEFFASCTIADPDGNLIELWGRP